MSCLFFCYVLFEKKGNISIDINCDGLYICLNVMLVCLSFFVRISVQGHICHSIYTSRVLPVLFQNQKKNMAFK